MCVACAIPFEMSFNDAECDRQSCRVHWHSELGRCPGVWDQLRNAQGQRYDAMRLNYALVLVLAKSRYHRRVLSCASMAVKKKIGKGYTAQCNSSYLKSYV